MLARPEFLLAGRVALECLAPTPKNFAGRPIGMDAFSEVLSGVKLKGALFFSAEFSAPWAFAAPRSTEMASTLAPGAPHLVIYHLVVDGVARATLPDGHTLTLEPGDIVVFPHGDAHELSSMSGA